MKRYFASKADVATYVSDLIWGLNPGYALTTTIRREKSAVFCVTSVIGGLSGDTQTITFLNERDST